MISRSDSPGGFWSDLWFKFASAYEEGRPQRLAEIYSYARWCCEQPRGKTARDDLLSIVSVSFYEAIPTHPKALQDMPNWWTLDEVRQMRQIFSHFVGDEGYAQVLSQFGVRE